MNRRNIFRALSVIFFSLGMFFFIGQNNTITGAIIGTWNTPDITDFVGLMFLFVALIVLTTGENLDDIVADEHHWRVFRVNDTSIIADIDQGYLNRPYDQEGVTPVQERIERTVANGKLITDPKFLNKKSTYNDQFYEGHASQGGRVIDVESHIAKSGSHKGRLVHFNQPANAKYLWIVDEDGNFIIANRQTFHHNMDNMEFDKIDLDHRLHKLPHPTIARGKNVYGSGEVIIEGGLVKEYDAASGHYIDLVDVENFNKQSKEVFEYFMKKSGWKEVPGGAKYKLIS